MSKELTDEWAIITPENCQEINAMISEYKKKIERLQEQLDEANRIIQVSIALVDKRPREMMRRYLKKWIVK